MKLEQLMGLPTADCLNKLDLDQTEWNRSRMIIKALWKFSSFPHKYQTIINKITPYLQQRDGILAQQLWTLLSDLLTDKTFVNAVRFRVNEKVFSIAFVREYTLSLNCLKVGDMQLLTNFLEVGKCLFDIPTLFNDIFSKNDLFAAYVSAWVGILLKFQNAESELSESIAVFVTKLLEKFSQSLVSNSYIVKAQETFVEHLLEPCLLLLASAPKCAWYDDLSRVLLNDILCSGFFKKSLRFLHENFAKADFSQQSGDSKGGSKGKAEENCRKIYHKLKSVSHQACESLVDYYKCFITSKCASPALCFAYFTRLHQIVLASDQPTMSGSQLKVIGKLIELNVKMGLSESADESAAEAQTSFYDQLLVRILDAPTSGWDDDGELCRCLGHVIRAQPKVVTPERVSKLLVRLNRGYLAEDRDAGDKEFDVRVSEVLSAIALSFYKFKKMLVLVGVVVENLRANDGKTSMGFVRVLSCALFSESGQHRVGMWPHGTVADVWKLVHDQVATSSPVVVGRKRDRVDDDRDAKATKMARIENGSVARIAPPSSSISFSAAMLEMLAALVGKLSGPQLATRQLAPLLDKLTVLGSADNDATWLHATLIRDRALDYLDSDRRRCQDDDVQVSATPKASYRDEAVFSRFRAALSPDSDCSEASRRHALEWMFLRLRHAAWWRDEPLVNATRAVINDFVGRVVVGDKESVDEFPSSSCTTEAFDDFKRFALQLMINSSFFLNHAPKRLARWVCNKFFSGCTNQDVIGMQQSLKANFQKFITTSMWHEFVKNGLRDSVSDPVALFLENLTLGDGKGVEEETTDAVMHQFIEMWSSNERNEVEGRGEEIVEMMSKLELSSLYPRPAITAHLILSFAFMRAAHPSNKRQHDLMKRALSCMRCVLTSASGRYAARAVPANYLMHYISRSVRQHADNEEYLSDVNQIMAVLTRSLLHQQKSDRQSSFHFIQPYMEESMRGYLRLNLSLLRIDTWPRFSHLCTRHHDNDHHVTVEWWKKRTAVIAKPPPAHQGPKFHINPKLLTAVCDGKSKKTNQNVTKDEILEELAQCYTRWCETDDAQHFEPLCKLLNNIKLAEKSELWYTRLVYDLRVFLKQISLPLEMDISEWRRMLEHLISLEETCDDLITLLLILHPNEHSLTNSFGNVLERLESGDGVGVSRALKLLRLVALSYDKKRNAFRFVPSSGGGDEDEKADNANKELRNFVRNAYDAVVMRSDKWWRSTPASSCVEVLDAMGRLLGMGVKVLGMKQVALLFSLLDRLPVTSTPATMLALHHTLQALLLNHPTSSRDLAPHVINLLRRFLRFVIRRSRRDTENASKVCECLERTCHLIAQQYSSSYKQCCIYVIAIYVHGVGKMSVVGPLSGKLESCMFHLMSVCDDNSLAMLHTQLPQQLRDIYRALQRNHARYFNYSGHV